MPNRVWLDANVTPRYRVCRTLTKDLRAQAFLIWKVESSATSLYGRFRAQAFLIWEVESSATSLFEK